MKDSQNIANIRRTGLYGKLAWRFGLLILMFMLVRIGYRLRDIQYELMDESHSRKSDEQNEAIYDNSEEFHDYRNDMENRQETKPENNLKDTDWEYSGRIWPLPKHQIFKELNKGSK